MKDDIFEALYEVRANFIRAGLEPPQAIILATHKDGMRFLSAIAGSGMATYRAPDPAYKPINHPDGSVWMEAEFAGIKIHWPANRYVTGNGGYVFG